MISDLTTQHDGAHVVPAGPDSAICNLQSALYFCVPLADQESFARLTDKVRKHTTTTLTLLQRIHHSRSKSAEARAISFERAGQRGFSAESLLRKYYAYIQAIEGGGTSAWKAVLDRAQAGPAFWNADDTAGLPPQFIEFWKSLCERNQRKTAPTRRALLAIWRTHRGLCPVTGKTITYRKIPGYAEWPSGSMGRTGASPVSLGASPNDIPLGWSAANLNRHAPDKFELAVARQGRESGAQHRRKVFTTRHGLAVGQFYLFDDLEFDKKVNFPGNRHATRPLGLLGLDLFSACIIANLYKPVVLNPDGARKKLKERDMLWLIVDVLCNQGFRGDDRGTHLVVEHGTAAIRHDFEERILAATGGKVTVDRSGLSSAHMPGLFEGQSKGNPRFKAALESIINLIHNEGAALPGATGKDRDSSPRQLAGIDKYNNQMLKLARLLPPHRAALLQFPVLNFHEFCELTQDILARINRRTEHELEGWQKCKHYLQQFFLNMGSAPASGALDGAPAIQSEGLWLSQSQLLALDPQKRKALEPFLQSRCRNLSPWEVWSAGASQLQKLGDHSIPILLGPDFGEERTVRGGYITIEDQEIDSEPLRFPAHPHNTGDKFLVYLNPLHPDRLILTDAQGRYVRSLERQFVPCRADAENVLRQLGQARKEESERLAGVVTRALPVAAANRAMHQNNLAVVNGQPVTNEEITAAQELRARIKRHGKAATDDMLSDARPVPNAEGVPYAEPRVDASAAATLGSGDPLLNPVGVPYPDSTSVLDDTLLDEML